MKSRRTTDARASHSTTQAEPSLRSARPVSASEPPRTDTDSLLLAILERIDGLEKRTERQQALLETFASRLTDTSHLTLDEIAGLQNISKTSARRRYGQWLEEIPGTRRRGVPRERVFDGWVSRSTIASVAKSVKKVRVA